MTRVGLVRIITLAVTLMAAGPNRGFAQDAPSHRAEVAYVNGLLEVKADNSSLNQILREVARLTGMKITGGVAEDRVFGTYGPKPAGEVLSSLLDGSSTNVLILDNDAGGPAELILTPRQGGVTPPNPNAVMDSGAERERGGPRMFGGRRNPQQNQQFQRTLPQLGPQPVTPASSPEASAPPNPPAPEAPAQPTADSQPASTPPASDPSQPASPNGVATPQQIYEQLLRLRQQQQQQSPPSQ